MLKTTTLEMALNWIKQASKIPSYQAKAVKISQPEARIRQTRPRLSLEYTSNMKSKSGKITKSTDTELYKAINVYRLEKISLETTVYSIQRATFVRGTFLNPKVTFSGTPTRKLASQSMVGLRWQRFHHRKKRKLGNPAQIQGMPGAPR